MGSKQIPKRQNNIYCKFCHKVCYKTKAKAQKAMRAFGRASGCKCIYRCDEAYKQNKINVWHLTSMRKQ